MRVSEPVLFAKFTAFMVALLSVSPVLLFHSLPFWAYTLLFAGLTVSFTVYVLEALAVDQKNKEGSQ